ncbi:MAG: serine/threonine-protein kinase, partial [Planctomycetota bacterium JB042]
MSPEDEPAAGADSTRLLRELMEECLDRVETDGLAVIDDVCDRHPEIATDLRRRLKQLFDLGLLGESPAASEREFPERLGDFRLLRCLGGGGMGVVYLAEQESLGRRVALKLVRPEHLYFPGARERFRREAEAVARLKHPGIVAIHAVGEENGLPFFAMERVEGASLAEVIRCVVESGRRSRGKDLANAIAAASGSEVDPTVGAFAGTWSEAMLRIARDVARALDHAHKQGVLHRDVKPSNVMITPAGRVLLLDFGLASLGDAEPITRSGSALGSMAYMAPEQVRGEAERVDERTDVYALGVTLYELLALARPYPENDVTQLQLRIVSGDAPSLRRRAPDVPWDAETVCLKAMDPAPERRYASAAAFARDLDNVLELRPIEAARAGPIRRLRKWARRRPAAAVALALSAVLATALPAVYLAVQARAAERVRATLDAALDGMQTLIGRVGDPELAVVPEVVRLRQQVLGDAAVLFRRIELTEDDPIALRLRLEELRVAVAKLLGQGGEAEAAVRAYGEAIERLDAIGTAGADRIASAALAATASLHQDLGDVDAAESRAREAIRRFRARLDAAEEDEDEDVLRRWVSARETLAAVLFSTGRSAEAIE